MNPWKAKRERGSEHLIRLIVHLARGAGRPLCRALLYPIVAYFVIGDGQARRASREFLARARGRPATLRDVFAHLHCFAATLLDRVYMAAGEFDRFALDIVGREHLERALDAGQGCLLMGSHLGSFDLVMLANRAGDNRPVAVMMHVDPRARLRRIAGIDDSRVELIALGRPDSFLRAYEVLARGGLVAVLADRADGAAHLEADFLGRPAPFPLGPHLLAARAGASVVLFYGLYLGGNRYRVEFVDFGPTAPAQARGGALAPMVERYARSLADQARRHPYNWFNFYPFWSRP
jgi:predicted LPLAT superfamily acyltransferase